MMKTLSLILLSASIVLASSVKEEIEKFAEVCAKEHNVDFSDFKTADNLDMAIFENNREYKCFGRCVALKSGVIDENGEPATDKIKEKFNLDDETIEIMKKCAKEHKDVEDKCDKNFKINHCVLKEAKAKGKQ